jgi:hypothetical protein
MHLWLRRGIVFFFWFVAALVFGNGVTLVAPNIVGFDREKFALMITPTPELFIGLLAMGFSLLLWVQAERMLLDVEIELNTKATANYLRTLVTKRERDPQGVWREDPPTSEENQWQQTKRPTPAKKYDYDVE